MDLLKKNKWKLPKKMDNPKKVSKMLDYFEKNNDIKKWKQKQDVILVMVPKVKKSGLIDTAYDEAPKIDIAIVLYSESDEYQVGDQIICSAMSVATMPIRIFYDNKDTNDIKRSLKRFGVLHETDILYKKEE